MKKRVFSLFMALALCLSMLPAAAMAEGGGESGHTHCICGATHKTIGNHNDKKTVTFDQVLDVDSNDDFTANGEKISDYSSNGLPAGNYYLEKSITIKKSIKVYSGTVNICLNGHNITLEDNGEVFYVVTHGTGPAVLNLTNCGNIVGKVTHSNGCTGSGVTLGSSSAKSEVFNLYGGEITGNMYNYGGAGVYVRSANTNAEEEGCTFNMYGGAITGNMVSSERNSGGGVSLGIYSKFNLYDGVIKNNISPYYGGGVSVAHESEFVMSGGEISENSAGYGGGVSTSLGSLNGLDPSSFTMTGGTITKNTASQGGGVYHGGETFNVSGNATITGNTANNKTDNVYLRTNNGKNATITIGEGGLGTSANIGVTASTPSVGLAIATGTGLTETIAAKFTSDNDQYKIVSDTDKTKLVLVENTPAPTEEHKHCICGETHTNVGDHTSKSETTFATKLWMDGDTLKMGDKEWKPTTTTVGSNKPSPHYVLSEGSYYLGSDIKLTESIHIQEGVQLCLNGHSIISDGADVAGRYVIIVESSSLVLTDCKGSGKITHADGKNGGGVSVYNPSSVFNMFGGIITGNNIDGGVKNNGAFNMYGGEISDNTATSNGGGVYVGSYSWVSFNVSGSAKITGNTVNKAANNVYLPSGKTIAIGGLTGDADIGVTTATDPEENSPVTITTGVTADYSNKFASDKKGFKVECKDDKLVLVKKSGDPTPPTPGKTDAGVNITAENANDPAPTEVVCGDTFKLGTTLKSTGNTQTSRWTWTSSDDSILAVTGNRGTATVKALKVGTATITVTYESDTTKDTATATITVKSAENPPRPSSGSSSRPSYSVSTPGKTENGSVSADVKNAKKGSTVTITVKPEDGFKLADLTVTDKDGNELELTDKGDGKYTFTMPAGKVEISAAFAEKIEVSPFEDVNTGDYCYEAVKWAAEQGITGGVGGNRFGSGDPCTRAQIVTFLWRAAGSPVVNYAMDLADVDEGTYYAEAVRWALSEGVTSGTSATTFGPEDTCTRAQAVTFLFKAMNAAAEGKADFADVADSDWFASAVAWAVQNGVTAGIGGGRFGSGDDCTRAQIVTFLFKAYNK